MMSDMPRCPRCYSDSWEVTCMMSPNSHTSCCKCPWEGKYKDLLPGNDPIKLPKTLYGVPVIHDELHEYPISEKFKRIMASRKPSDALVYMTTTPTHKETPNANRNHIEVPPQYTGEHEGELKTGDS